MDFFMFSVALYFFAAGVMNWQCAVESQRGSSAFKFFAGCVLFDALMFLAAFHFMLS